MTPRYLTLLTSFFSIILCFSTTFADIIPVEKFDPVASVPITSTLTPSQLPLSGTGKLKVTISMPEGYHITSRDNGFFDIKAKDTLDLKFGEWQYPAMVKFGKEEVFQGKIIVTAVVTATGTEDWRSVQIPLAIGYQICAETGAQQCFLPTDRVVVASFRKVGATASKADGEIKTSTRETPKPIPTPAPAPVVDTTTKVAPPAAAPVVTQPATTNTDTGNLSIEDKFQNELKRGSWFAFFLVFVGGILGSLTPCVYPIIPITMGYIGSRSGGSKLRGFTLSLAFVLGLAIVYSTLGLVAASTGALFGSFTQTPWFIVPVGLIIGVMGISMLGVFDIPIPGFAAEAQGRAKGGYVGAAVMGGMSGLVAAPCVGPVLVALLAWVAQSGSLLIGFFMLFTFSIGMGLLFIVIGTFSGMLQALPSAGEWMVTIKKFFGVALLAGALFLIRAYIPTSLLYLGWSILLAFSGFLLWGKPLSPDDEFSLGTAFYRALALLLMITAIIALIAVVLPLFGLDKFTATTPSAATTATASSELAWMRNDEAGALAKAKQENKPVLIDFYADWCAACVELDEKTWPDGNVKQVVSDFVLLKFDFTKQNDATKALMVKYKIQGLPTVLLLTPDGVEKNRFAGFKAPNETIQWVKETKM